MTDIFTDIIFKIGEHYIVNNGLRSEVQTNEKNEEDTESYNVKTQ